MCITDHQLCADPLGRTDVTLDIGVEDFRGVWLECTFWEGLDVGGKLHPGVQHLLVCLHVDCVIPIHLEQPMNKKVNGEMHIYRLKHEEMKFMGTFSSPDFNIKHLFQQMAT